MDSINHTKIIPLLTADQIFLAELSVIDKARPDENLYISHYTLPSPHEGASNGTPASDAQREFLTRLIDQAQKNRVNAYVIADNGKPERPGETAHNEKSIRYLHDNGALILPYPKDFVAINHSKFVANERAVVISSCNASQHSADSPDDNTGFLIIGPSAWNGITHAFIPQWNFSVEKDRLGWSKDYASIRRINVVYPDNTIAWLNTAPKEESHGENDIVEIKQAYIDMISKAADAPPESALYFEHFDLSHIHLAFRCMDAKEKNPSLDLRFIIDPNQYLEGLKAGRRDARTVAFELMRNAKIPIRFAFVNPHPNGDRDPQRFHDKFVVLNDQEVINGSGNLSSHSLDGNFNAEEKKVHNREIDVLVRDPQIARVYRDKFLDDWIYRSFCDPEVAAKGSKLA